MLEAMLWFIAGVGASSIFKARPAARWFVVGVALTSAIYASSTEQPALMASTKE